LLLPAAFIAHPRGYARAFHVTRLKSNGS